MPIEKIQIVRKSLAHWLFGNRHAIQRSMFMSLPFTPREIRATESRLVSIYNGAHLGLKGERLAVYAGMLPAELERLRSLDPLVELAELKGRADAEAEAALTMQKAIRGGDTKAALAVLQHRHEWTAKQDLTIHAQPKSELELLTLEEVRQLIDAQAIDVTPQLQP